MDLPALNLEERMGLEPDCKNYHKMLNHLLVLFNRGISLVLVLTKVIFHHWSLVMVIFSIIGEPHRREASVVFMKLRETV